MTKNKKGPVPSFPIEGYYPSGVSKLSIDLYNGVYNKLFPVRPWVFGASAVTAYAYFHRNPSSSVLALVPNPFPNSDVANVVKLSLASVSVAYTPVFLLRSFLKYFIFSYKGFLFEKKPSLTTKIWAFFRNLLVRNPRLNSCDVLLPNLPVPDLKETVKNYLESMQEILSEDEFRNLSELAEKFLKEEGWKLQLLAKLLGAFKSNYVTPFWEKYAYLMGRDQLTISSSVAHADLFKDIKANQAVRAAHVVYIEALSMLAIYKQQLKPLGDGLVCSLHYHRMYAGTRVPEENIDHLESYKLSRHVTVYCNGCFYKIDIFDENGKLYPIEHLCDVFTELVLRKDTPIPGEEKLAALTFDQRTSWSKNRIRFFLENNINRESLKIIETSMVFLTLDPYDFQYDPEKPELLDSFLKQMLTGDGKNRWSDKSLNYVVGKSGRAGGTTEHSIGDGAEFDHIMENFVNTDVNFIQYPEFVDLDTVENYQPKTKKLAQRLNFEISEDMIGEINRCYDDYQPKIDDIDLAATVFRDFGKGLIKKGKCSPDAFIQMAIQLANFKNHGKFSLTYESASVRFYANSRTETLRTVTKDSCDFVRAMLNPESNDAERLDLLRKACETHGYRNRLCMVGKGIDRHLFVLYVLSRGTGYSSPFLDHYISQQWILSTSQIPTLTNQINEDKTVDNSWLGACFGPVAKDGYGICYRFAGNHSICAHISSFKSSEKTDSHKFQKTFIECLHEMVKLFEVEGVKL